MFRVVQGGDSMHRHYCLKFGCANYATVAITIRRSRGKAALLPAGNEQIRCSPCKKGAFRRPFLSYVSTDHRNCSCNNSRIWRALCEESSPPSMDSTVTSEPVLSPTTRTRYWVPGLASVSDESPKENRRPRKPFCDAWRARIRSEERRVGRGGGGRG